MKKLFIVILLLIASPVYATQYYNATSPWYTQIPASPTLDSESEYKIKDLFCFNTVFEDYPNSGPRCTGNKLGFYTAPTKTYYLQSPSDPEQTIISWTCAQALYGGASDDIYNSCTTDYYNFQKQGWNHLKIPAGAEPHKNQTSTNDGNLDCFPKTSGSAGILPQCRNAGDGMISIYNDTYEWTGGGCVYFPSDYSTVALRDKYTCRYWRRWDRSGLGYRNPDDGLGGPVFAGIPHLIGLITYEEVCGSGATCSPAGRSIDHALSFSYSGAQWPHHWLISPPVSLLDTAGTVCINEGTTAKPCPSNYNSKCTGNGTPFSCCTAIGKGNCLTLRNVATTGTLPLLGGERLYLPSTVSCYGMPTLETAICNALKKYGMIFIENAGPNYNQINVEDPKGKIYENEWNSMVNVGYMRNIPWSQLKVSTPLGPNPACTNDTAPPTTPTGVTVRAGSSTTMNIAWTASTDNCSVVSYTVSRCTGVSCTDAMMTTIVSTTSSVSLVDSDLTPATTYKYKIQAFDQSGNRSSFTSIYSGTTDPSPVTTTIDLALPTAVLDLTAEYCTGYTTAGSTEYPFQKKEGTIVTDYGYAYFLGDEIDLYYCFRILDSDVISSGSKDSESIGLADSVELAIDNDGSGTQPYWRFTLGPNNNYADYLDGSSLWNIAHIRHATDVTGTLNDNSLDTWWTIKGHISWALLGVTRPITSTTGWKIDAKLNRKTADTFSSLYLCNIGGGTFYNPSGMCNVTFNNTNSGAAIGTTDTVGLGSGGTAGLKIGVQ